MKNEETRTVEDALANPREILRKVAKAHSLKISRMPEKTKKAFIELADQEFCGDYGMTLKALMDGQLTMKEEMFMATLENHETRIVSLEHPPEKPEKEKRVKMLDGTEKVMKSESNR